jgi:hypothetical protein
MNKDTVIGGVEVLHSSRVSDEKVRFLDKGLPWCEVKAENVLKSTGHIFAERSHNQVCESCKRIEACRVDERAKRAEEAILKRERDRDRLRLQQERLDLERRHQQNIMEQRKRLEHIQEEQEKCNTKEEAKQTVIWFRDFQRTWDKYKNDMELYDKLLK